MQLDPTVLTALSTAGVLMITAQDAWKTIPFGDALAGNARANPGPTPTAAAPPPAVAERTPAVTERGSFYTRRSTLSWLPLTRRSQPQQVAKDVYPGTRVVAVDVAQGTLAAYVANSEGRPSARLAAPDGSGGWRSVELSEGAANAQSVALVQESSGALFAVYLDARAGISSLHARSIEGSVAPVRLGADRVLWTLGTAQPTTEVFAVGAPHPSRLLIALERDASHFGLAQLTFESLLHGEPDVNWLDYPNGLEHAPVAAVTACGADWLAYVRPQSAAPRAAAELRLAELAAPSEAASVFLASAREIRDVVLARLADGVAVLYATELGPFALRVRCQDRKR